MLVRRTATDFTVGSVWFFSTMSDVLRTRWPMLMVQCILGIPTCIMLTIWTGISTNAKYWCCKSRLRFRHAPCSRHSLQHVHLHGEWTMPLGVAQ